MLNKETLLRIFKFGRGVAHEPSYDKRLTHPVREWFIGLAIFTMIIAIGSAKGVFDFITYQNVSTFGGTFDGTILRYNTAQAQQALSRYQARKDAYEALQKSMYESTGSSSVRVASSTKPVSSATPASSTADTPLATSSESAGSLISQ